MTTNVMHIRYAPTQAHTQAEAADNAAFGFWIYVMSDGVLFAALFATFAVLGHNYAGGPNGKDLFDLRYTLGETLFLLSSSVTYGFAMLSVHADRRRSALAWLAFFDMIAIWLTLTMTSVITPITTNTSIIAKPDFVFISLNIFSSYYFCIKIVFNEKCKSQNAK